MTVCRIPFREQNILRKEALIRRIILILLRRGGIMQILRSLGFMTSVRNNQPTNRLFTISSMEISGLHIIRAFRRRRGAILNNLILAKLLSRRAKQTTLTLHWWHGGALTRLISRGAYWIHNASKILSSATQTAAPNELGMTPTKTIDVRLRTNLACKGEVLRGLRYAILFYIP